jgi:hypothetical protein
MDYSATLHDSDNPGGASPWGNSPGSSPQHHQTSFGSLDDPPNSPFRYQTSGSAGLSQNHSDDLDENAFRRPDTASTASGGHDADTEDSRTLAPSDAFGDENRQPETPQKSQEQERAAKPAQAGQEGQSRRPPQPQLRLQAKITGLERAGKKDPILRFDVHVGLAGTCVRCHAFTFPC